MKVSVIIPVYKPNEEVFKRVKDMLKKQTIKSEIIEMWNNPEAVSVNKGVKKAKGEIVIIHAQDYVPEDKHWLEKLIKPLESKEVIAGNSYSYVPEWYWKKYPFFVRILTLNELERMAGRRDFAFRKKDFIRLGMFNEDPKVIAIDSELGMKLEREGKIVNPNVAVEHLHSLDNKKKIILNSRYAESRGKLFRRGILKKESWKAVVRATPILGMLPIIYVFPWRKFNKYWHWFFLYLSLMPLQNLIYIYNFWKGFLFDRESERNKEVLRQTKNLKG